MTSSVHYLDAEGPRNLRIYAIGDVHGLVDLLRAMHRRIEAELASDQPDDWRIIHLGDYCDRGPNSRAVIDFLIERQRADPRNITLLGNHDRSFLDFIGAGDTIDLFSRYGGAETAASYGVRADFSSSSASIATRDALRLAVPLSHISFLENLSLAVEYGDFFFCHAGIKPGVPLDEQDPNDLIWIRGPFLNDPRLHPKIIVHGHTPVPGVEIMPNRVDVDTGAYQSGVLSALVIDGKDKRVISVSGSEG